MSTNGRRRPSRPSIELVGGSATPAEAAAIAAALERFLADTAPSPEAGPMLSRWQSAALREGVEHAPRAEAWGSRP